MKNTLKRIASLFVALVILASLVSCGSGSSSGSSGSSTTTTVNNSGRDTSDIASTGYVTLENGTESEQVKTLQKRLKDLGYYNGNIDGRYGEGTVEAVRDYQTYAGLRQNGIANIGTQLKLDEEYSARYQNDPVIWTVTDED